MDGAKEGLATTSHVKEHYDDYGNSGGDVGDNSTV